jgi:DNA invertase Pin-like site-specific DNA recombinase
MSARRTLRCAIYTRKSTEEGLEQDFNSLDAQREACEAYVISQKPEGWIALSTPYDDGGYSGGTLERPALHRLMADIEAGSVDVVVVYKIDRLSRSLLDFTKLVEVFDRKNVTFVSVTQSFNTTTSMGRLTLNVLLSFAQFEREVTGERIRDKFAASKKKGIWMGGTPSLGYDIVSRKLIVSEPEAETVRLIFQRYLDLGCARALRQDLKDRGVASKVWTSTTGIAHGGKPFDRGALYYLLKNRLYLGETMHKGSAYRGEHDAIVPRQLFEAVQERLAISRRRQLGKSSIRQDAPLSGLLFDESGARMRPTYGVKRGGVRYRYYASVSRSPDIRSSNSISRISAPALEGFLHDTLARLRLLSGATAIKDPSAMRPLLHRVTVRSHSVIVEVHRTAAIRVWQSTHDVANANERMLITSCRGKLGCGEELSESGEHLALTLPVRARFRGGRSAIVQPAGSAPRFSQPDAALIKAVARAHRWKQMLLEGRVVSIDALAAHAGQERRHVGCTLNLAFLAPDLACAIVNGGQPAGLRLAHLLDADIPISWGAQRSWIEQLVAGKAL